LHDIDQEGHVQVDSVVQDNAFDNEDNHFNYDCDEDNFGDFEVFPPIPSVEVGDKNLEVGSEAVQCDDGDSNVIVANTNMAGLVGEDSEVGISCPNFDHVLSIQEEISSSKGHNITVWEDSTATTTNNSVNTHINLSSAFDGLLDVEDAPLPPLESFYSTTFGAESGNMDVDADYDEFCEFETAIAGVTTEKDELTAVKEGNFFSDDAKKPQPCSNQGTNDEDIELYGKKFDGVFDAFGKTRDAPVPGFGSILPSADERDSENVSGTGILGDEIEEDNDDFGDFEGVVEICNVDDNYEDANVIIEDSLFHPLADALPLTTNFGSFDGQGENVLSRETICNASNFEIPSFTDCQVANHSHNINSSASGTNECEEVAETEAALHVNDVDQLDSLQEVSKNYVHDVCGKVASLKVNIEGQSNADEKNIGQLDDCREAGIQNSAVDVPEFHASFPESLTETEFSVIDSLSAIDNDVNSKARGAFGGENEGDFSQFESHLITDEHLENIQGRAYTEESYKENSVNQDEFDAGFGDFASFEETYHNAISRKCDLESIICRDFGHEFNRLVGCWKHIISVVEHDLQQGSKMMNHLANNISAADRAAIIKSVKLRDFIRGLAEVVRIVRSITATIGELLCTDKNIEVHESTLPQWNDEVIIADAIVIEFLWSQIIYIAIELRIISQPPQLETVIEIRNQSTEKADLCQLTLRSLLGGSCTKSSVTWKDKKYMACAANFCANRMPELKI
jgi:hypothetical protein